MTSNSLMLIYPYKSGSVWAFDDSKVGLVREPFVGAINVMIDKLCASIDNAEEGICMVFAGTPFPGYQIKLTKTRSEWGGNWYVVTECTDESAVGIEGWLCPALFKYFAEAPESIYVEVKPK